MSVLAMRPRAPSASAGRRRLRILTWHVHGNYLYSLTQVPHDFIIPVLPGQRPGYGALGPNIPWGANVRERPAAQIKNESFDCVVYQSRSAFELDRRELLSADQQRLPCAYIEHNPPEPHPTDTRHCFRHDKGVLIHVTAYNALMWNSPDVPSRIVEHGIVPIDGVACTGELARGITAVNHLQRRGRRVGADIYEWAAGKVPLDLIGMQSQAMGGLGEIPNMKVPGFMARYRFFFTPIRYASLGLSLIEAMMAGLPIVGIAATELPNVITNGVDGYVDTRRERLLECMRQLLADPGLARDWGQKARLTAQARFGIDRFIRDWEEVLGVLTGVRNE